MQLSKNFTLSEFLISQTASRLGIDNTPSQQVIDNLTALCQNILQPLRDKFGPVVISSGYRSPQLNKAIGGAANSQHMLGQAADIHMPSMANDELARLIAKNFVFDQVILEFYTLGKPDSGWVHVSYNAAGNKREQLTATKQNGATVYLKGIVS
jgi:zinc D-Ala-D-Ala carboxypeptidase